MLKQAGKNPSVDELRACDRSFAMALTMLERVRVENLDLNESRIQFAADLFHMFPNRMGVLTKLVARESKIEDLEAAFWTAEQGTARAFLESLGSRNANVLAGVDSALQSLENELRQNIHLLDQRLAKEFARTTDQRDAALVGELLDQRRKAAAKLGELMVQIEKDHPQYAGLKYPRPCTPEKARACIAPDEVALLFVCGPDFSFAVLMEARPKPGDPANA
jgi:hypothetical protein